MSTAEISAKSNTAVLFKFAPGQKVVVGPHISGKIEECIISIGRLEPLYSVSWWQGDNLTSELFSESEIDER